ncbi:MAG TPA: hypothetical protein PLX88_08330 [Syntrophorhabdaceae bacterium]|jgi:hypothetical protein|nr:hypothetical protein [Syntrophorhabdaceae bacterium]MDI9560708.1 hypothetical protein [Pseudomonadota bacterium]MBV6505503.1 hypothetical protein [Syntrophorhabdaceae bacterium]HNQ63923.1 hypothetical protein [Syntrophorhabdaceae bacterium]HNZ59336.1 hypothetical protein [Syntrophorhabdaceae bacterium]
MRYFTIFLCLFFLISCNKANESISAKQKPAEHQTSETNYKKEIDELRKNMQSEIKIKLKKDVKGGYGWEIAGKDAQEILRANEMLRKRLDN